MIDVDLESLSREELIVALKESQSKHKNLDYIIGNVNGITWEFDLLKDKFKYVSPNAKEILGYELSEWKGLDSWISMIHEEDREKTASFCATEIEKGKNHFMEYRMLKKNGDVIWVFDSVSIVRDSNAMVKSLYGIILDITAQKKTQQQLETKNVYLQSIMNNISYPIMVIKKDFTIELMNDKMRDTLSHNLQVGQKYYKCYEATYNRSTPCDREKHSCPLRDTMQSKKSEKTLHQIVDKNGVLRYIEQTTTPLFDANSECLGIVKSSHDITEHILLVDKLKERSIVLDFQANHDTLTKLPNRQFFRKKLDSALQSREDKKRGVALLFIDLDDFKSINDTHGHLVGDAILQEVAKRISSVVRDSDTFSRLGGDEFTVIMHSVGTKADASTLAEKILRIFDTPFIVDEREHPLSCSIGISCGVDAETSEDLLENADRAMYRAK